MSTDKRAGCWLQDHTHAVFGPQRDARLRNYLETGRELRGILLKKGRKKFSMSE